MAREALHAGQGAALALNSLADIVLLSTIDRGPDAGLPVGVDRSAGPLTLPLDGPRRQSARDPSAGDEKKDQ